MPTQTLEIHALAQDGRVEFQLPTGYPELANAQLLILVSAEPAASIPIGHTDWDKLTSAYAAFEGHDPYPTITDSVAWQRQLRTEDEREFDR